MTPPPARAANERWAIDFVSDSLASGKCFRALTVIDTCTRESLAIHADFSLPSSVVTEELDRIIQQRGKPKMITLDIGSEFTSNHFDAWAYAMGIQLDFNQPGRPVENGFIASFNGRLRDESLNRVRLQT